MSRVLLVNMPFNSLRWPALGVSLLKAGLARAGVACDVAYLNFDLAETIGLDSYDWVNDDFGFVLGGERLFAREVFPAGPTDDEAYVREVLHAADPGFGPADREAFEGLAAHVGPFLDRCLESVDWGRYGLVGFSVTFQQTLASLALASRLKRRFPGLPVVFGGASCEGEMGAELLRRFPQVDHVFSGEADETFPPFAAAVLAGRTPERSPGVLSRAADGAVEGGGCGFVATLDALPYPDFGDYFDRLARSPLRDQVDPLLLFETARGCWWGARSHCTFCGLNGGSIAFRSKSPARALDELQHLSRRHGLRRACATDNVMDHHYHRTLLPALREAGLGLELEYELKTNLTREQVQGLVAAGLRAAQLGVESLSTPVLRLMRKGVNAAQNVQTLKWMSAAGVEAKWNLLYGVPGETAADYAGLPDLIARLTHLVPPQAEGPVRVDRFSPYFREPGAFGLGRLRPAAAYRHVYPFDEGSLARLAYYFECDGRPAGVPDHVRPVLDAVERWRELAGTVTLRQHDLDGRSLLLHDTRPVARAFEHRLTGLDRVLYRFCDRARPLESVVRRAREVDPEVGGDDVARRLERWVGDAIMVRLDGVYLSLALDV